MALRSIHDADYDEATTLERVEEEVQGQPQTARDLDDGKVTIRETRFAADTVIVDPNHELAVQVLPEGSTVGIEPSLVEAWRAGTPEDQFAAADKDGNVDADKVKAGTVDPKDVTATVPAGPGTEKNAGNQKK